MFRGCWLRHGITTDCDKKEDPFFRQSLMSGPLLRLTNYLVANILPSVLFDSTSVHNDNSLTVNFVTKTWYNVSSQLKLAPVTSEILFKILIVPALINWGLCYIFMEHKSACLTIWKHADLDDLTDMRTHLSRTEVDFYHWARAHHNNCIWF